MGTEGGAVEEGQVLILGASFAGIEFLYQLRRAGIRAPVTVVDRQAHHPYLPLIHEGLTGRLSAEPWSLSTADYLNNQRRAGTCEFIKAEVESLDPETREVRLGDGRTLRAKIVVVALGSRFEPPPKLAGGQELRRYKGAKEVRALEKELAALPKEPKPSLLVVGGGISGVEMAGELAHRFATAADVHLVHSGAQLLPALHPRAGKMAQLRLEKQGVELHLETRLESASVDSVELRGPKGTRRLATTLAFWGGGVRPAEVTPKLGLPLTEDGWVRVGPTLQAFPGVSDPRAGIFVIGDLPRIFGGDGRWPTMQRAIECLWQAKVAARNAARLLKADEGEPYPPLKPHVLRADFAHGISIGACSLIAWGPLCIDPGPLSIWFRRFLMRQYFKRYPRD